MSTIVMAGCWPLQMPPTPKAVLISLADQANDQGVCWPAISTICERTCFGKTAVIDAIKWLEEHGLIAADRSNGRHTSYQVIPNGKAPGLFPPHQSGRRTGAAGGPVREADRFTANGAGNRSGRRTGPANEPVRETVETGPGGGLDRSGRRTLTVKNRKEPSSLSLTGEREPGAGFETQDDAAPAGTVEPTVAVQIAVALRKRGMAITGSDPRILAAVEAGVTVAQVEEMAEVYPTKPPAYVINACKNQLLEQLQGEPRRNPNATSTPRRHLSAAERVAENNRLAGFGEDDPDDEDPGVIEGECRRTA